MVLWREARAKVATRWRSGCLTLLAKTVLILSAEVLVNALIWIVSVIVFSARSDSGRSILSLALVAWTTGLRHGLDADHISAIDNATRRIVSVPAETATGQPRVRRPVTVGLFFSLGHSTIVIATIVAVAISAQVANNLDGFGNVGSVVGASISSSFLILIGCINCFILYRTWTRMRAANRQERKAEEEKRKGAAEEREGQHESSESPPSRRFTGMLTRIAMPLLRTVDRPWKLYPVGLLFGLGFDTASSIALLSVAVIAQQRAGSDTASSSSSAAGNASVILLALLFTAGMTLVDSIDSCLMIWAYAPDLPAPGKRRFTLWETETSCMKDIPPSSTLPTTEEIQTEADKENQDLTQRNPAPAAGTANARQEGLIDSLDKSALQMSIILTLLSILIAFAVGLIQLLGLIGERCARCSRAADKQEASGDGGLEGRWWLTWRRAGDNFGYIGAAIVGLFAVCVLAYFASRWVMSKRRQRARAHAERNNC